MIYIIGFNTVQTIQQPYPCPTTGEDLQPSKKQTDAAGNTTTAARKAGVMTAR
jgi:hypothetical protein